MTFRKATPDAYSKPGDKGKLLVEFWPKVEKGPPVLTYIEGYVGVTIASNQPSWGAAPVAGADALRTLTEGLLEACAYYGIEVKPPAPTAQPGAG